MSFGWGAAATRASNVKNVCKVQRGLAFLNVDGETQSTLLGGLHVADRPDVHVSSPEGRGMEPPRQLGGTYFFGRTHHF